MEAQESHDEPSPTKPVRPPDAAGYAYLCPAPTEADTVGLALSGGGVRAACLALGALQVAEERQLLRRTKYVSAVSGGSYIAAAFLASRSLPPPPGAVAGSLPKHPWCRGSREEKHLKRNLHYLVENTRDLVIGITQYLWGLLLNLIPLLAGITLLGTALGLMFDEIGVLERTTGSLTAPHRGERWGVGLAFILASAVCDRGAQAGSMRAILRGTLFACAILAFVPDVVDVAVRVRSADINVTAFAQQLLLASGALVATLLLVLRSQWAVVGGVAGRWFRATVRFLFALSWLGAATLLLAYATAYGVRESDAWRAGVALAISAGTLLVCGVVLHANLTSLHDKYSRRLARAFLVRAESGSDTIPTKGALSLDHIELADLARPGLPELVICAAVNLRERDSALGEGCASFVFTPTIVGSPALSYLPTKHFCKVVSEQSLVHNRLHLASLIAASGAAVAPNMGRYSRKGSRLALAVFNLRLGLWIVNPFLTSKEPKERHTLRHLHRFRRWVEDGWREPGPLATIQEAFGALSVRNPALFISDGGHWDNSGIVELLRRRCSHVVALDASNDQARLANILRTISLARSELGVEFDADGSLLESEEPVRKIAFRYPDDGLGAPPRYLILLRTFMSEAMPADLVAMPRTHGAFPRHSTRDQFFSAHESDAYVALGRWLCERGIDAADLPPVSHDVDFGRVETSVLSES